MVQRWTGVISKGVAYERNFSHSSLPHEDDTLSSLSPSNSAVG